MRLKEFLPLLLRLPAQGALLLIRLYQLLLSPLQKAIFGPAAGCRFYPSCSEYGLEAIRQHGLILGGWRTSCRILKCHPFHPGGFDPVPPRRCCGSAGTSSRLHPRGAAAGESRTFPGKDNFVNG